MFVSPPLAEEKEVLQQKLSDFFVSGTPPPERKTLLQHIGDMPVGSIKNQICILGSISNFHWWVSLTQSGTKIGNSTNPRTSQFLLFHPGLPDPADEFAECPIHLPASPRNQLIFFKSFCGYGYGSRVMHTLQYILNSDRMDEGESDVLVVGNPPAKKKRKYCARVLKASREDFLESLSIQPAPNMISRDLYPAFAEEVASDGSIQVRVLSDTSCIIAMNDYCNTTGKVLPLKFVHVTCLTDEDEPPKVRCSCPMYTRMQGVAMRKANLDADDENTFLASDFTCMHCLFYLDFIHSHRFDVLNPAVVGSQVINRMRDTLEYLNQPVALLGIANPSTTTKLSVLSDNNNCSIVHVHFTPKNCFANCKQGMCQAKLAKHRIPITLSRSLGDEKTLALLCSHMKTLGQNLGIFNKLFPEYFTPENPEVPEAGVDDLVEPTPQDLQNVEDFLCGGVQPLVSFDIETGLWDSTCFSKYIPTQDMEDPHLVQCTSARVACIRPDNLLEGGLYKGPPLTPDMEGQSCACGSIAFNDPVLFDTCRVYTRLGLLLCDTYSVKCSNPDCEINYIYNGKPDHIFFLKKETGIAQEVIGDFIALVKKSSLSFTGYSKEKTRQYVTTNAKSAPFMSNKWFINHFFCWLASLKIDFRLEVDPWCGHNPKFLAGDGTKIGVSCKYMNLDPPTTQATVDHIKDTQHRKYNRCLLQNPTQLENETGSAFKYRVSLARDARSFLTNFVQSSISGLGMDMDDEVVVQQRHNFFQQAHELCRGEVFDFISLFIQGGMDQSISAATASLLALLTSNYDAVSVVLPFRFHGHILETCDSVLNGSAGTAEKLHKMREYNMEVADLLQACLDLNKLDTTQSVVQFLRCLLQDTVEVHASDTDYPPPAGQEGTYNPPSGAAYYMTPHGQQVRDMPKYSISAKDNPKDTPGCQKRFPMVSYKGFGYMFLMFCPYHRHCYGFHLIDGGEGAKDPFSAMFKYMEEPPQEVFYDFACRLHEYSLNREPAFFKCVRFWHDLFHGVNHICGDCFKSTRILALDDADTEVCEQFNAYLQCIKYTASSLGQANFMLFTQYFIYLYNKSCTERYLEIAKVAMAGCRPGAFEVVQPQE